MRRRFIETSAYSKRADVAGDAVRKLRVADPRRGKGKRGGHRVIHIDMPARGWTYLLMLYDKDEQADLSSNQRRELKRLADEFRKEDMR